MADNTDKLDLEINNENGRQEKASSSQNISGSDLEIKDIDVSGDGIKKIDGNKIEIDVKADLPKNDGIAGAAAAAAILGTQTDDDAQENETEPEENFQKNTKPNLPPNIPPAANPVPKNKEENSEGPEQESRPTENKQPQANPTLQQNQPGNEQPPAQAESPQAKNEQEGQPQPDTQNADQPIPAEPQNEQATPQPAPNSTPAAPHNNPAPTEKESPAGSTPNPEQNTPNQTQKNPPQTPPPNTGQNEQADRQPPTVSKNDLGNIGPHGQSGMANYLIDPTKKNKNTTPDQTDAPTNPENNTNATPTKTTPPSFRDNIKNKANQGLQNLKNTPQNTINNIKNNLSSDRFLKQKLQKRLQKVQTELASVGTKLNGLRTSNSMRIIKFFFPGLYSKIFSFSNFSTKLKGEAKLKALQAAMATGNGVLGTLKLTRGTAVVIEAHRKFITWFVETLETVIIPIVLLVTYPLLILLLIIQISFTKLGSPLVNAIDDIIKRVNEVIKELDKALATAKKEVRLMREASEITKLMASTKEDRTQYLNNAEANDKKMAANDNTESPPAANDNTESAQPNDLPQAA
ncbi:MAG: hypothetical protein NT034_02115 [Candidatus Magasanikbacteria bacterium]|nr:hypothetical protein [Candidatus Magasanikbacteria bacterium]